MYNLYMKDNQVILGKWEDLISGVPDGFVDLIHTDPPYGSTPKRWDKRPYWKAFLEELTRVSSPSGQLWIYVRMPWAIEVYTAATDCGWKYKQEVIWEKQNAGGCTVGTFRKVHENLWHFVKPGASTFNLDAIKEFKKTSGDKSVKSRCSSDTQFMGTKNSAYKDDGTRFPRSVQHIRNVHRTSEATGHPTQKPLRLTDKVILYSSNPGDLVFDPYCGSGTSLVSAAIHGRRYLGIDREEEHVARALARLEEVSSGLLLPS